MTNKHLDNHAQHALIKWWTSTQCNQTIETIQAHGLSKILPRIPQIQLPPALRQTLQTDSPKRQQNAERFTNEISQLLHHLKKNRIPCIALGSLASIATLHFDSSDWLPNHTKFLIHPEHIEQITGICSTLGFESAFNQAPHSDLQKKINGKTISLQFQNMICNPIRYPIDRRELWAQTELVQWNKQTLAVLCPPHAFLDAILAMVENGFDMPFLKLLDLHWKYSALSEEERESFFNDSKEFECLSAVKLSLDYLHHWFEYSQTEDIRVSTIAGFTIDEFPPCNVGRSPLRDALLCAQLIDKPKRRLLFAWDWLLQKAQVHTYNQRVQDDYIFPESFIHIKD